MAKQKKRIILTGAQGVGKTTLMNALATDGTKTLSIAREQAIEAGWSPETGSSEEYQKKLFAALLKAVSSKRNYVSDRGLSCVAAYTFSGALNGDIKEKIEELKDEQSTAPNIFQQIEDADFTVGRFKARPFKEIVRPHTCSHFMEIHFAIFVDIFLGWVNAFEIICATYHIVRHT